MQNREWVFVAAVVALFSSLATAQDPIELRTQLWSAQWIVAKDVPQRDESVLHFRKVIELDRQPEHFVVHVSADNQFLFYVNQQRAGMGPALGDLAHWRFETYDIAPMLHAGKNLLAATVWNFGVRTPVVQMSDRTAFILHGDGASEHAADTDAGWEVEQDKGLETLPEPEALQHSYYVAEPGERIDAAAFDWLWNGDSKGLWVKAVPIGNGQLYGAALQNNSWQLVPDALPAMQMDLAPAGRVVRVLGIENPSGFPDNTFIVPAHSKASILIDNTHLTTGYPELTVSGGAGATVGFTYAEALVDDKGVKGNRNEIAGKKIEGLQDEFLPDGKDARTFMPLGWRAWRYLQLDVTTTDRPLRVEKLRTWFTAYPFEERGYFHSDDASLQPIWEIGWRTARMDAHSTYMDTPYWERLQYVGDTRVQTLISYTVAGDDRLPREAIQAFNDSHIGEGLTRSRYPSELQQIIPTFSLLWVGMVHDFWFYRSDPDFVRAQLPGTETVLDWFIQHQRSDGLLDKLPWWPFIDWGSDFGFGIPPQDENGGSASIALQFVEALRYGAEMEAAYGNTHRAETYRSAADHAAQAVRGLCWNQQYGLIADTPAQKHYSQHANILAVWLDVIPRERQKDVLTKVLSASDPGFTASGPAPQMTKATYYFRFYLARALQHVGMGDEYLRLLGPWRKMVALGLTTWAEQPEPTRSDSHAWSAHPNFDLLTIVAGIRPKSPGFAAVIIEPNLGALKHVSAALAHPKGMIAVEYTRETDGVKAQVSLPAGLAGDLIWNGKSYELHEGSQQLALP